MKRKLALVSLLVAVIHSVLTAYLDQTNTKE